MTPPRPWASVGHRAPSRGGPDLEGGAGAAARARVGRRDPRPGVPAGTHKRVLGDGYYGRMMHLQMVVQGTEQS